MGYSFFAGCKIPYYLPQYGSSAAALLNRFGIELLNPEFNCCGYPVRDIDMQSFLLAGARNLAIAERQNTDIVTPCKCCFGSLKFVEFYLRQSERMRDRINDMLRTEGLQWEGRGTVSHLLTALHHDVGLDALRAAVVNPFDGLKVAVHTGCHALRPGYVTGFDNPLAPQIFDELVTLTGAESVFWPMGTECCGHPQWDKNRKLARKQMQRKLADARRSGADVVCTACTYCQMQFDRKHQAEISGPDGDDEIPAILISQLLGLSIGLEEAVLGLHDGMQLNLKVNA